MGCKAPLTAKRKQKAAEFTHAAFCFLLAKPAAGGWECRSEATKSPVRDLYCRSSGQVFNARAFSVYHTADRKAGVAKVKLNI